MHHPHTDSGAHRRLRTLLHRLNHAEKREQPGISTAVDASGFCELQALGLAGWTLIRGARSVVRWRITEAGRAALKAEDA